MWVVGSSCEQCNYSVYLPAWGNKVRGRPLQTAPRVSLAPNRGLAVRGLGRWRGGQPGPSERGGRLGQCSQDGVGRQQQGSRHDQTSTWAVVLAVALGYLTVRIPKFSSGRALLASVLHRGGEGLTRTADGSEWWSALRLTPQMGWYMAIRVPQGWEGHWQRLGQSPGTGSSGKWSSILVWDQRSPRLVGWGGTWLESRRSAWSHIFTQELSG